MKKDNAIAMALKKFRVDRGLTVRALAKKIKTNHSFIGQVEMGNYDYPIAYFQKVSFMMTLEEKQAIKDLFVAKLISDLDQS